MASNDKIAAMLKLHDALRSEIETSIRLQHTTFGVAAALLSLGVGLGLGTETFQVLLLAVPPLAVFVVLLWIIEMARMMRCGNYLQFVEDKLNREFGSAVMTWENWLRRDLHRERQQHRPDEGLLCRVLVGAYQFLRSITVPDPHALHRYSQRLFVVGLLLVAVSVSLYLPFLPNHPETTQSTLQIAVSGSNAGMAGLKLPFSPWILTAVYTFFAALSTRWVWIVVFHKNEAGHSSNSPEVWSGYVIWEERYFNKIR
jgi:hypothetical protein